MGSPPAACDLIRGPNSGPLCTRTAQLSQELSQKPRSRRESNGHVGNENPHDGVKRLPWRAFWLAFKSLGQSVSPCPFVLDGVAVGEGGFETVEEIRHCVLAPLATH